MVTDSKKLNKVFIAIDSNIIELKGAELEAFEIDRAKIKAETDSIEFIYSQRKAKLESALNKLKSLGLTESEAKIIIGLE